MGGVDDQKNYDALMKQIKAVIDADSAKIILVTIATVAKVSCTQGLWLVARVPNQKASYWPLMF